MVSSLLIPSIPYSHIYVLMSHHTTWGDKGILRLPHSCDPGASCGDILTKSSFLVYLMLCGKEVNMPHGNILIKPSFFTIHHAMRRHTTRVDIFHEIGIF